jgi:predicted lipid-binding transport protein (Tim44 family)
MSELLTTLMLGGVALFLAYRLYTVLGRREGHMEQTQTLDPKLGKLGVEAGTSHLRPAFEGPAAAGLESIAAADKSFDPGDFLDGARSAYSLIVQAFAEGNKAALQNLLAAPVYDRYSTAIDERAMRGEHVKTEIERIASTEIIDASHENALASVTVEFNAEIATETVDSDDKRVSGDLGQLTNVCESWIFVRRTDSLDPNWVLSSVARV